jgi:hypothetical protein
MDKGLKYGLFDIVENHKHELGLHPDKRFFFDPEEIRLHYRTRGRTI